MLDLRNFISNLNPLEARDHFMSLHSHVHAEIERAFALTLRALLWTNLHPLCFY